MNLIFQHYEVFYCLQIAMALKGDESYQFIKLMHFIIHAPRLELEYWRIRVINRNINLQLIIFRKLYMQSSESYKVYLSVVVWIFCLLSFDINLSTFSSHEWHALFYYALPQKWNKMEQLIILSDMHFGICGKFHYIKIYINNHLEWN